MNQLYIDETGNADLQASTNDPNHRYLSLTGIIMDLQISSRAAHTRLEALKAKFFGSHPDDPIVLHRKDVMGKNYPFHALRDPVVEAAFNADLLAFLRGSNYEVITVVIDKLEHLRHYGVWRHDPYHYCLEVLVERYVLALRSRNTTGDVMAEVRGGKPDRRLEKSFAGVYENGSRHVYRDVMRAHLSSKKLKLKKKEANVTGLQMADMIAHPSAMYVRSQHNAGAPPDRFGGDIVKVLEDFKYRRNGWTGKLEGYGVKWLP